MFNNFRKIIATTILFSLYYVMDCIGGINYVFKISLIGNETGGSKQRITI